MNRPQRNSTVHAIGLVSCSILFTLNVCGQGTARALAASPASPTQSDAAAVSTSKPVDFDRDILPVLSDNCFQCHGPDASDREAGLRLDRPEGAFAKLESGETAILPGDVEQSAALQRILSADPDLKMPPPDSGKTIAPHEIQNIKRWISDGAKWQSHWAFTTPESPPVPVAVDLWSRNAIDRFIRRRLATEGLAPAPEADRATLIRRVSFDLTGLPPTTTQLDAFVADASTDAYERLVDRLLASPYYGEHMARYWLDAARFADTHGLHLDNERSIWPYRNWVIAAFNRNMPFDQFTVEQLAGDLLPNPTLHQQVATGFNRCNVTTGEGGSIDEEYYVRYAVERVETTATVWLGLTAGCAVCHDHKFDPMTQKEFYQLFSYFFSLTEAAMDGNVLLPPPSIKVPTQRQTEKRNALTQSIARLEKETADQLAMVSYADPFDDVELPETNRVEHVWIDDALPKGAEPQGDRQSSGTPWQFVSAPDHPVYSGKTSTVRKGSGLNQHFFTNAQPPLTIGKDDQLFAYVFLDPADPPETVQLQFNDGNWNHRAYWGADKGHAAGSKGPANFRVGDMPKKGQWVRLEVPASAVGLKPGSALHGWAFTQFGGTTHWDKAGVVTIPELPEELKRSQRAWENFVAATSSSDLPKPIQEILAIETAERNADQRERLRTYFLQTVHPETRESFREPLQRIDELKKERNELDQAIPATLVMKDREQRRQAHVLERGEYTLKRDKVQPKTPTWLPSGVPDAPANRLGLAQWLIDPTNPLTARVTVNRLWQQMFGTGLVKTAEDFGVQGERPSHPELLDWLATDFVDQGWNVKRLLRMIVMSSAYRQSAHVTPRKLERDFENRLVSRGPRFRLDAEMLRDSALAVSGLLVHQIGGRSVKPYQPANLWKPVGFGGSNTREFKQDHGPALYRRSLYTFWKRTSPPPSMDTFDAPNRETCTVRRARTNTPLQALVLMNDVQFFEAARRFAERTITMADDDQDRIDVAFRSATARSPSDDERATLLGLLDEYRAQFKADPTAADKLLSAGESPIEAPVDRPAAKLELAAWTMITHLILNLDEVITKG